MKRKTFASFVKFVFVGFFFFLLSDLFSAQLSLAIIIIIIIYM